MKYLIYNCALLNKTGNLKQRHIIPYFVLKMLKTTKEEDLASIKNGRAFAA